MGYLPTEDQPGDRDSRHLEKFRLYETRSRFYLIGSDRERRFFRVLKIDRLEPSELNINEDPVAYSQIEIKSLLQRIGEGNKSTGGLSFVAKVYGIAGCIRFLESYYLILITKRQQIGSICGHAVYSIKESQMITVPHSTIQSDVAYSKTELRYKKLLSSVELTKDFFYSYTYPIMRSLQKNVQMVDVESMAYENIFVWNTFLTESIRSRCTNPHWTVALVHGYFEQVRLSIFGRDFCTVLISRRSRHFAGTRYLKRGVNDKGRVANDVETEQIVLDEEAGTYKGRMTSIVQMRGSIPLFWSQEASRLSPKPDIIVQRYDPTYHATQLHFEDLVKRYGNPIFVLNLIKHTEKRPREMILRREFAQAVGYLNQILPEDKKLKFIHWDFHKFAKTKTANVLAVLGVVASEALDITGFFLSGKPVHAKKRTTQVNRTNIGREASLNDLRGISSDFSKVVGKDLLDNTSSNDQNGRQYREPRLNGSCFQSGVLRTNCIDCLDRTNIAQYACGLEALGRQLHALGLTDTPKVDHYSSIAAALRDMYLRMGDVLAQQYGGSAAHNTVFPERQGKSKATTQSLEFLKSIRRFYSNAYTDGEKQDAMNLFLGYFQPQEGKPALWELDSDYYLHVSGNGDEPSSDTDRFSHCALTTEGRGQKFAPISTCKRDFHRMKLTSFDKLIEATCSSIKNVRLCAEPSLRFPGSVGNSAMAADAAQIQLITPNWLFGQRRKEDSIPTAKDTLLDFERRQPKFDVDIEAYLDLDNLSPSTEIFDQDVIERYQSLSYPVDDTKWYGGQLLYYQDESSEAYKHYAEICQGQAIGHFGQDVELEQLYHDSLRMGPDCDDASQVEQEMEALLGDLSQIGTNLGILPNGKFLPTDDPSQLTRWLIGHDKLPSQAVES